MKQLLFMTVLTILSAIGGTSNPVWPILLYYGMAVLRPQYLWKWALPDIRWSLIAGALVLASVVINIKSVAIRGRFNVVIALILAHALFLLLSLLNAYDPATAQVWAIEYGKIVLMAIVASFVLTRLSELRLLALVIFAATGYIGWEMNYLYFVDGRMDIYHNGFGGLDNNGAGLLLSMGLPLAYLFGMTCKQWWRRGVSWFAGVLILHAMLMSYSRGAMLSAMVGLGWLLIHHRPRRHAVIMLLVICMIVPLLAGKEIRARFFSTTQYESDYSANSRFESWAAAWRITTDHPLTGIGIRNSNAFSQQYGADLRGRTIHSQYLQIAADSGIPAMLTYAAMLIVAGISCARARAMCRRSLSDADSPLPQEASERLRDTSVLAVACQSSLLIFAFGAGFLSLEVFELPWILMVLSGVLPGCVQNELAESLPQIEAPPPQSGTFPIGFGSKLSTHHGALQP
ncbi:MAG: O-antigen ligase family protein [Phycisphaeraceae bacterium]|nr:O-antigen ligase family protein [Phycisphaeraceae bacterium]